MPQRIGITGADGQLGRSIRKIAAEFPAFAFAYSDLPGLDIADTIGVERWVTDNGIELIVNCAAYTAVDQAENEPDTAWRVNALGPQALAEVCAARGVRLIHISTDYVFDGNAQNPYTENDMPHPLGVYGATKRQGERAVERSGADAAVVRTSWLYSEFGRNFVKTMLRLGAEKERVAVVADQHGSPTSAANLARAVLHLAGRPWRGFELYHYCDAGVTNWYDFAREIFTLAALPTEVVPIPTADYPTAARRPMYSVLDTAKIRKTGVRTPEWRQALKEVIEISGAAAR